MDVKTQRRRRKKNETKKKKKTKRRIRKNIICGNEIVTGWWM